MSVVATGAGGRDAAIRRAEGRRWLLRLAGYGVLLSACFGLAAGSAAGYWASNALVAALGVHAVAASRLPPSAFGLTLRGAARSIASALVSAALLLAGGGVLLLLAGPAGAAGSGGGGAAFSMGPEMLAYLLVSVPAQELLFRGAIHGGVRWLLGEDRRASAVAVLVSTLAFGAIHLPWGGAAALLALAPGLVWGIQFERDRSLLGVTLSHVVVGAVFLGALPLWSLVAAP